MSLARALNLAVALNICLLGAACSPPPPEVKVISVPSSKPYSYIRWSKSDTPETVSAVKRHNRAHQAVINAEKKAKAGG